MDNARDRAVYAKKDGREIGANIDHVILDVHRMDSAKMAHVFAKQDLMESIARFRLVSIQPWDK